MAAEDPGLPIWTVGVWGIVWEEEVWRDVGDVFIPSILEDLTTLWCQEYQPDLHAVRPGDDTTRITKDIAANVWGYDGEHDLNTALAKYIDTEH